LIAHGSRQEAANVDLYDVAARLRELGAYDVIEVSFLELAEPTIPQGAASCMEQGAELVVMLPYFLSAGVHVRRDLVAFRQQLVKQYPAAQFRLAEPLGRHPALLQAVIDRAQAAADQGQMASQE
jgi:sirohydrochlorin ferrochelatase